MRCSRAGGPRTTEVRWAELAWGSMAPLVIGRNTVFAHYMCMVHITSLAVRTREGFAVVDGDGVYRAK